MKRFVNFRPLLLVFFSFVGAVYSVIKIFLGNYIPIIIFGIFLLLNLILFVISFFKKDFLKNIFERFGIKSLKLFCSIILVSAIVSSGLTLINLKHYSYREFENGKYSISAKVKEISNKDDEYIILLGDVKIDNKSQNFNLQTSIRYCNFDVGDILTFDGNLYSRNLIVGNKLNTNILKNKVFYNAYIDFDTFEYNDSSAGLIDSIKNKGKTVLIENMSYENAGFSYAIIFGDKTILSDEYYESFKNAGLAHLLAVSGLHIAFLVGILNFVLKLCKTKSKTRFFVIFAILILYNIICKFSPSVFRASVMSLCLMLGLILGERNDSLSNVGLAGVIVLTFQPLYFFDIGFLLSFGAVFGIILFSKPISKQLAKLKLPEFLANSIAVTLSATVGTTPFVCKYFGTFAPISLISNLIVLPLFSIMFSILLVCTFVNMIINFSIILHFAEFFVNFIVNLSKFFAIFGTIKTIDFDTISIFIYFFVCFLLSPFFMISAKSKLICSLSFVVLLCSTISIATVNNYQKLNVDIATTKGTSNAMIFKTNNNKTILTNVDGGYYRYLTTKSMLRDLGVSQIDYLLIFNYKLSAQNNICDVAKNYNINTIYIFGEYTNEEKISLASKLYFVQNVQFTESQQFEIDNFSLETSQNSGTTKAISYTLSATNILQILTAVSKTEMNDNFDFYQNTHYDFCICNAIYDRYFDCNVDNFFARQGEISKNYDDVSFLDRNILWTFRNNCATI